jgi:predicted transcriptional regulator YdeE
MQPTLVTVSPFVVRGLCVRTSNADEFDPARAKLPGLWGRFYGSGLMAAPEQAQDAAVYGVYSDYESDANGFYDLTAGVAHEPSEATAAQPLRTLQVQGGQYLVFAAQGAMPQAVIDAWGQVWEWFAREGEFVRAWQTDFEQYSGTDKVAIHIGVKAARAE